MSFNPRVDTLPQVFPSPVGEGMETPPEFTPSRIPVPGNSQDLHAWLRSILDPSPHEGDLGLLGDYRIRGILGRGGMGVVLDAWERALDRPIALKLILPTHAGDELARSRFLREARAAAAVHHQRIVPIFAVGEWRGSIYLAMPLLAGESLASLLKRQNTLPLAEALQFTREAAEGLAAAHARGLTHRDIKPDNIWIEETEQGRHVRLLDFGLARGEQTPALTQDGGVVGTPRYMAPEQAEGQPPEPRADLFSLGCVLYEMLAGRPAFEGNSLIAILNAIARHQPPEIHTLSPSTPAGVSTLIERLLAKKPEARFESAVLVAHSISELEAPGTPTVGAVHATPRKPRRAWVLAAAVILAAFAFIIWRSLPQPGTLGPLPEPAVAEATRVLRFDVRHFAKAGKNEAVARGILGQQSFTARQGDQVTIDVELSRPAYAYLVAFRPDGVMELIVPDSEDTPPVQQSSLQYPPAGKSDRRYGLAEGAGLWVFAIAVSDEPLPAFRDWAETRPGIWKLVEPQGETVIYHDGQLFDMLTVGSKTRGKDEAALGPSEPFAKALQYLKNKTHSPLAAGVGVSVQP